MTSGTGEIKLSLRYVAHCDDPAWAELAVQDSRPGFPEGLELSGAPFMGYRLVNLLTAQLQASHFIANAPGVSVRIEFPITWQ